MRNDQSAKVSEWKTYRSQLADERTFRLFEHSAKRTDEREHVPQSDDGVDSLLDELARQLFAVSRAPGNDDALLDHALDVHEAR